MKAPKFWFQKPNLLSLLFWPFSKLYQLVNWLRERLSQSRSFQTPIWCVGNITLGGSGKTPVTLALSGWAEQNQQKVCIVSKGYMGTLTHQTITVNPNQHTAKDVGDEAILLAQKHTTIVGKDRISSLIEAEKQNPSLIIMDDGYQNPTFKKSLHILIIHSLDSLGNKNIFPAGPLRQSIDSACNKADMILTFENTNYLRDQLDLSLTTPLFQLTKKTFFKGPLKTKNLWAFCGLGNPDQFYQSLIDEGYNVLKKTSFADHATIPPTKLKAMIQEAKTKNLSLVCTTKDAVKIHAKFLSEINVAHMEIDLPASLIKVLSSHLTINSKNEKPCV
ncbi:MAG: tetraacyldisaccharide 4'-kinase [Rickettsiales bacterium]|nr:tetraacyldisaccharide 4'-kinase [Rickettsiales bacterium]|tara:strand:+ start:64532 stop:65530 length:999 start_codon:yes stop_codon:yes gene_type:complete